MCLATAQRDALVIDREVARARLVRSARQTRLVFVVFDRETAAEIGWAED